MCDTVNDTDKMMENETIQIINKLLVTFQRVTGLEAAIEHPEAEDARNQHPQLRLTVPNNTQLKPFQVLYTPTIDKAAVAEVTTRAYKTTHPIIATPAMTPEAAKRLQEDNLPYLDGIGNAYVNERGVFILVNQAIAEAQKARPARATKDTDTDAKAHFGQTSEKVLEKAAKEKKRNTTTRVWRASVRSARWSTRLTGWRVRRPLPSRSGWRGSWQKRWI